uniref:OSJNBa0049H08.10 protein n=1 Tax=Oryza sativa subsp. japonica TaxID=39947 RepID=Q7XLN1_ORYSJ|nr:OSJNBa0049H08.10 [Oryza sativa Japonica Group]
MDRQWIYADRWSKEFIDGVHYFLRVAEANRHKGFICCPCNKCKNQKEYSASRTIHFHLFESGFMPSYNCWTSHGEQGVEMEEDEVEDDNIPDFAQYVGFEGNQTGEEERDADGNDVADDLDVRGPQNVVVPRLRAGAQKVGYHSGVLAMEGKNGVSDKAFGDLLKLVKNILPDGNKLPRDNEGVPMLDEDKQEEFNLRALVFVTINDWPALSNLSESTYLKHYRKVVYMGHRRFLAANHPVRKKGKHFEHKADHCTKPKHRSGKTVFAMVKDLKIVFGKGPGSQPIENEDGHAAMWKKNSIFWELPYWEFLDIRHTIDVMHLTKNLCVNLLGFLGVYGKSKDTLEARNDLKHMEQRGDLHPEPKEKESHYLSLASYTLSKVPSGYSTNIKRIISTKEKKFTNLKSHDCHVLMTQLLPVVIRGIVPDNVRATITKLCAFMNAISQKVIDPDRLEALQNDVVQCLVSFELIFPPSFFNIMTHLLCHLVKEIRILGPVYLHNMFSFKRYMGVLKKYVRNRARPEASIAKGYGTEEVIEFCVEFIEDLRPIGVPESRHEGRLQGKGTLGRKAIMTGYEINGYTFYTRAQDMKSTNQNSVVRIDAMGHDGTTGKYYGAIEDIWELDYGPLNVPLFQCQWVRLTGGGVMVDDSGMTTVDLNKVGYSDEPFVLANDVTQVFYMKDMSSKGKKGRGPDEPKRHVVFPGKRKIVGVEDKTDEDYDQLDGQPPFTVTIDPSILLSNEDTPYSRSDHKEGTIVRRKYVRSTVTADVLP